MSGWTSTLHLTSPEHSTTRPYGLAVVRALLMTQDGCPDGNAWVISLSGVNQAPTSASLFVKIIVGGTYSDTNGTVVLTVERPIGSGGSFASPPVVIDPSVLFGTSGAYLKVCASSTQNPGPYFYASTVEIKGTYLPEIVAINPDKGPTVGGTSFIITGNYFATGASVDLGGAVATDVIVVNSSLITGVSSPHVKGLVDVTVTNPDLSAGSLDNGYTYGIQAQLTSVEVLAQGSLLLQFDKPMCNDAILRAASSYTITEPLAGVATQIVSVQTGNSAYTDQVVLHFYPPTIGEEYTVTVSSQLVDGESMLVNPAHRSQSFVVRKTKMDVVMQHLPALYDQSYESVLRNVLQGILREDDSIGGSQDEVAP